MFWVGLYGGLTCWAVGWLLCSGQATLWKAKLVCPPIKSVMWYWACVALLDHAIQVVGVALVRAHCGLTNVANLCEHSVGLLSWALRRCPRPNISRHGKTGQNFLTRLEPNFFNPKQKRVDPWRNSCFFGSTWLVLQLDPNPNHFFKTFFLGKKKK